MSVPGVRELTCSGMCLTPTLRSHQSSLQIRPYIAAGDGLSSAGCFLEARSERVGAAVQDIQPGEILLGYFVTIRHCLANWKLIIYLLWPRYGGFSFWKRCYVINDLETSHKRYGCSVLLQTRREPCFLFVYPAPGLSSSVAPWKAVIPLTRWFRGFSTDDSIHRQPVKYIHGRPAHHCCRQEVGKHLGHFKASSFVHLKKGKEIELFIQAGLIEHEVWGFILSHWLINWIGNERKYLEPQQNMLRRKERVLCFSLGRDWKQAADQTRLPARRGRLTVCCVRRQKFIGGSRPRCS